MLLAKQFAPGRWGPGMQKDASEVLWLWLCRLGWSCRLRRLGVNCTGATTLAAHAPVPRVRRPARSPRRR